MQSDQTRDFIGYGQFPPDPKWPDGARLALNFVMNYEEGSEPSIGDGETYTELGLSDGHGMDNGITGRDLAGEGMFEYGSRVGVWRLLRLFQERGLPCSVARWPLNETLRLPPRSGRPATMSAVTAGAGSSTISSAKAKSVNISDAQLLPCRKP